MKQYIIRKFVLAKSVADALKKEKKAEIRDVWLDEEWMKQQEKPKELVGFRP